MDGRHSCIKEIPNCMRKHSPVKENAFILQPDDLMPIKDIVPKKKKKVYILLAAGIANTELQMLRCFATDLEIRDLRLTHHLFTAGKS